MPWTLDHDSSDLPSLEMNKLNFAGVHRLHRGSFAWLWWGGGIFTLVCLQIPKAYFLGQEALADKALAMSPVIWSLSLRRVRSLAEQAKAI